MSSIHRMFPTFPISFMIEPLLSHGLNVPAFTHILRIGIILYFGVCITTSFDYFPLTWLDRLLELLHLTDSSKLRIAHNTSTPFTLWASSIVPAHRYMLSGVLIIMSLHSLSFNIVKLSWYCFLQEYTWYSIRVGYRVFLGLTIRFSSTFFYI